MVRLPGMHCITSRGHGRAKNKFVFNITCTVVTFAATVPDILHVQGNFMYMYMKKYKM